VMKHLIVPILISILASEWGGSTHAQDTGVSPRVQQELGAMLARRKTEIQKERADCASKLGIPIVPNDTEELVARYSLDKAKAFNDCMIDESGVLWSMARALLEHKSVR
jgi:hypothetical protein